MVLFGDYSVGEILVCKVVVASVLARDVAAVPMSQKPKKYHSVRHNVIFTPKHSQKMVTCGQHLGVVGILYAQSKTGCNI